MAVSNYRIKGATGAWEVVVGLEVHAPVTSQARFCSAAASEFGLGAAMAAIDGITDPG